MKLGFAVNNLSMSQSSYYLITNINKHIAEHPLDDICVFFENPHRPCINPNFATMQMEEVYSYKGIVVATGLTNVQKTLICPGPAKKYFYVWDLEWTRNKPQSYHVMSHVYRDKELSLVARSNDHKQIIENCWNLNGLGIVDDFNINQFKEIFTKDGLL